MPTYNNKDLKPHKTEKEELQPTDIQTIFTIKKLVTSDSNFIVKQDLQ